MIAVRSHVQSPQTAAATMIMTAISAATSSTTSPGGYAVAVLFVAVHTVHYLNSEPVVSLCNAHYKVSNNFPPSRRDSVKSQGQTLIPPRPVRPYGPLCETTNDTQQFIYINQGLCIAKIVAPKYLSNACLGVHSDVV